MKTITFTILITLWAAAFGSLSLAPTAAAEEPIRIGALMPLSGQMAEQGMAFQQGITLAVDEINRLGGVGGRPLRIVFEDTQGNAKKAAGAAKKLISIDKVIAALTTTYPDTKVGGGEFNRYKIPAIALWDASPEIEQLGDYVFSVGPWVPSSGSVGASFAYNQLQARSAVIVTTIEEWSELVADYFSEDFKKLGGSVTRRFQFSSEERDFRTAVLKIAQLKPDVIYAPLTHNIVAFHRQLRQNRVTTPIVSSDIIADEHIAKAPEIFEGVYQTAIQDPENEVSTRLMNSYRKKYGKKAMLPWYIATGHDAITLLAIAMKESGDTLTPETIKTQLYKVRNLPGAAQSISIGAGGSAPHMAKMFRVRQGEFKVTE